MWIWVSVSLQDTEMLWLPSKGMSLAFSGLWFGTLPNLGGPEFFQISAFLLRVYFSFWFSFLLTIKTDTQGRPEAPLPTAPSKTRELGLCRFWAARCVCLLKGVKSSHNGKGNQTRMFLKASCVFLPAPLLVPTPKAPLTLGKKKYF